MTGLLVSEMFGPTFQGEGPSLGRRAMFLRLGLCNLNCAWCDTPYTWDWSGEVGPPQDRSALQSMEVNDVAAWFTASGERRLVITGGEPMVQRVGLDKLMRRLPTCTIEVETNGTIPPTPVLFDHVEQWNVSPKMPSARVDQGKAWRADVLADIAEHGRGSAFKFVVATDEDLDAVERLVDAAGIPPSLVWVMPEGRTAEQLVEHTGQLADAVLDRGWQLTTRLHVIAWGDRRAK